MSQYNELLEPKRELQDNIVTSTSQIYNTSRALESDDYNDSITQLPLDDRSVTVATGTIPRSIGSLCNASALHQFNSPHITAEHQLLAVGSNILSHTQDRPSSQLTLPTCSNLRKKQPKKTSSSSIPHLLAQWREASRAQVTVKWSAYMYETSEDSTSRPTPDRNKSIQPQRRNVDEHVPNSDHLPEFYSSKLSSAQMNRLTDSSMSYNGNVYYSPPLSHYPRDRTDRHIPFKDIETILKYCASTYWQEHNDGLISLTQYLADGKDLTPQQLQYVLDMFYNMFMNTGTPIKVYSLLLDSMIKLILVYANHLHDWLFMLLTWLFSKLSTYVFKSLHLKMWKTLQVVHEFFPTDLQMNYVFDILDDSTQPPCTKTKIIILKFLTNLATTYYSDLPSAVGGQPVEKAVLKIVKFANDKKSIELRTQARVCLRALYNFHTLEMTHILTKLSKDYQELAKSIIHSHPRHISTPDTYTDPFSSWPRCTCVDDEQNQKPHNNADTFRQPQPSALIPENGHHDKPTVLISLNYTFNADGAIIFENGVLESDLIKMACAITADTPVDQVQSRLMSLSVCIKCGNCDLPNKHFHAIMKMLLSLTDAESTDIVIAALHVLSKIIRCEKMKPNWTNLIELILLKIINCYGKGKETLREIDQMLPRIAPSLPLHVIINILNPLIATGSYPLNVCAIKLLNELVIGHGKDITEIHLDAVFPNLARLTDNIEAMVRKTAIRCLTGLYMIMGEDKMKTKLSMLNPSQGV